MSKMHLALVDQSLEKSMKSWKKLSKNHISNHIGKELIISFKLFGENWIQKKTRCLAVTWFNSEKFNGSNFYLRIIAKTKSNHFWKGSLRTIKNGLHTIIMYKKGRSQSKVKLHKRWQSHDWRREKWCCVCGVWMRLKRNRSLLLPPGQTIDFNLYCQQMEKLRQAIERKRPELINRKVVFHHDNARSHTSLASKAVLMHPPYSPDLALSDYHLFQPLQNSLKGILKSSVLLTKRDLLYFNSSF